MNCIKRYFNCFCFFARSCCCKQDDFPMMTSVLPASDTTKQLQNVQYLDTIKFVPPITFGKVIKTYDGDTITIAAKLPYPESPIYRFSVRLRGIDAAEIKGGTAKEKEIAQESKQILSDMIMGKMVTLVDVDTEKYGRLLAYVYIDDICLNTYMLLHGHTVEYDGGKKNTDEWK